MIKCVGRKRKILLVEFFNSSKKIAQKSEFNGTYRSPNQAEDRGQVDWPVDGSCTEHAQRKNKVGN